MIDNIPVRRPLVATLIMEPAAATYFNELRQLHFPPERNHLKAHLTLFHALPDEPWIIADLKELAESQQSFPLSGKDC